MQRSGTLIALLFASFAVFAQPTQQEILDSFFGPNCSPEASAYFSGELLRSSAGQPPLCSSFADGVQVRSRLMWRDANAEAYSVDLTYEDDTINWYAFLNRVDSRWTLEAVRTLAQVGLLRIAQQELSASQTLSDDERWELENASLILSEDQKLIAYFHSNIESFQAVAQLVASGDIASAEELARDVYASSVTVVPEGIKISLGGVLDNTVGYLYQTNEELAPQMTAGDEYIYVEAIADGWYIYKTT